MFVSLVLNSSSFRSPFSVRKSSQSVSDLKAKRKHQPSTQDPCMKPAPGFREKNKTTETISLTATFDLKPYLAPIFVATQYTKFHEDFFLSPKTPSTRSTILPHSRTLLLSYKPQSRIFGSGSKFLAIDGTGSPSGVFSMATKPNCRMKAAQPKYGRLKSATGRLGSSAGSVGSAIVGGIGSSSSGSHGALMPSGRLFILPQVTICWKEMEY